MKSIPQYCQLWTSSAHFQSNCISPNTLQNNHHLTGDALTGRMPAIYSHLRTGSQHRLLGSVWKTMDPMWFISESEPPAIKEIFLDHEKGPKHPVFLLMSADINSCGIEHYCLCDFSIFGLKSTRRQSSCWPCQDGLGYAQSVSLWHCDCAVSITQSTACHMCLRCTL